MEIMTKSIGDCVRWELYDGPTLIECGVSTIESLTRWFPGITIHGGPASVGAPEPMPETPW